MAKVHQKDLFTEKAEAYAKYRPSYPNTVIDKLLNNISGNEEIMAVDVGAGTGISSALLADRGARVIGIEPNKAMIEMGKDHPNIEYMQGSAESIPLEDNAIDLVTSFQSMHWFDYKKSLKEFNRILKPSGRLGIVWSYWDETDSFTKKYLDLISEATKHNKDSVSPYDGIKGKIRQFRIKVLWKFRLLPYFKNVSRFKLKYTQHKDEEGLIGCARSQSYISHEGKIWDNLVQSIKGLAKSVHDPKLIYNINLFVGTPKL